MARIELYATATFNVYKELSFEDKSLDIEKAKVIATQNLIKVLPTFTMNVVKIRKGSHMYDESIIQWPTIKQFIKQGVIKPVGFKLSDYEKKVEEPETEDEAKAAKLAEKEAIKAAKAAEKAAKAPKAGPKLDDFTEE